MASAKKTPCLFCKKPVSGRGLVCPACAKAPTGAVRRVAEKVRDRVMGGSTDDAEFVCRYCRKELGWSTVGTSETEVTIYVREKIYFCPECRSFLGVSSWHTEG